MFENGGCFAGLNSPVYIGHNVVLYIDSWYEPLVAPANKFLTLSLVTICRNRGCHILCNGDQYSHFIVLYNAGRIVTLFTISLFFKFLGLALSM